MIVLFGGICLSIVSMSLEAKAEVSVNECQCQEDLQNI